MKKFKLLLSAIFLFQMLVIAPVALAGPLQPATKSSMGADSGKPLSGLANVYDPNVSIESIISNVIKIVLSLLGVIFIILIVYAGYNWMTAAGDAAKVDKAKDTIQRAVIGLIVIAAAYAISFFVIEKLYGGIIKAGQAPGGGTIDTSGTGSTG